MKLLIVMLLLGFSTLSSPSAAQTLPPAVTGDAAFMRWYDGLAARISSDRKYKRIPLDTDSKAAAFVAKLHDLYRQKITEDGFFIWVDLTYPGHDYEQLVIVTYFHEHRPK